MNSLQSPDSGPGGSGAGSDTGAGSASRPPLTLKKVLVPLDFSEHCIKALVYARAFARQFDATILLLHVTEPVPYPSDVGFSPIMSGELEDAMQLDAAAKLKEVIAGQLGNGYRVETVLRTGRAFQEIVTVAEENGADLVIVTTHGYTGIKHVLLGSTAERVVRHAKCPVLVVRDTQHEFVEPSAGEG